MEIDTKHKSARKDPLYVWSEIYPVVSAREFIDF